MARATRTIGGEFVRRRHRRRGGGSAHQSEWRGWEAWCSDVGADGGVAAWWSRVAC